jgi:2-oxoglutarate ferredoxin oxidoreductase subunit alpha
MRQHVPACEEQPRSGAAVGILCCGTTHYAAEESRDQLEREHNLRAGYLRLKAFPFPASVSDFIDRHERVYVIDQNRDAQLFSMMKMDLTIERAAKLRSIRYYSGLPVDAQSLTEEIVKQEEL